MMSKRSERRAAIGAAGLVIVMALLGCSGTTTTKRDGANGTTLDGSGAGLDAFGADAPKGGGGVTATGGSFVYDGGAGRGGAGGIGVGGVSGRGGGGGLNQSGGIGSGGGTSGAGSIAGAGGNGQNRVDSGIGNGGAVATDGGAKADVADAPLGVYVDATSNPQLRLCTFDTTASTLCSEVKDTSPCAVPGSSLSICTCVSSAWRCGVEGCPVNKYGGPELTGFRCNNFIYRCLYPNTQLCVCDEYNPELVCRPLAEWNGVWDAGSGPVDIVSRPYCPSDYATASCDPNDHGYCTMANGRELCQCYKGNWACSDPGCPENPVDGMECIHELALRCNSGGNKVCGCNGSGHFLCADG
jgi:hypothetical protein